MKLRLADNFALPADAVTQTFAILAKRRAGKSYAARRLAEQLLRADQQVVIIDPKGDWWGIRSGADGKTPGFPVIVFGGEHGDLPLEVGAGEVVAKLVVRERVNLLLDLSSFRKSEVSEFMGGRLRGPGGFLEHLYRLKSREEFRTPMMLVVDEADAIAPQKPFGEEARMLGAIEDIVRRGGQRGIGCTCVTQRSAVLNKNVLTQSQVLIAMRTIAPQDLDAMNAWIDVHGTAEQRKLLMQSLPSLPVGDAWVWSPGWPDDTGIFQRVHIAPIETFDSGATPRAGEKPLKPKMLADVDLEAVRRQMADTIEKAKRDDPKLLRAMIANLEKELKEVKAAPAAAPPVRTERVEVPVLKEPELKRLEATVTRFRESAEKVVEIGEEISGVLMEMSATWTRLDTPPDWSRPATVIKTVPRSRADLNRRASSPRKVENNGNLTGPEQRILNAIAWYESIRQDQPGTAAVAFVADYRPNTGHFNNARGALRSKGLIEYAGDGMRLTEKGRGLAEAPETPLTAEEVQRHIFARLPNPEQRILRAAIDTYPDAITNDECARQAGFTPNTGHFNNARGRLRTMGLVEYPERGQIRARELLFLERNRR